MTRPTDPLYGNQWHLSTIGGLERVWDYYTGTGVSVVIYDDGVEASHPDLNDNYSGAGAFTFGGTTYTSLPVSSYGHGTSVAGIIAAEANNGQGGVGVAYDATIASLNFLDVVQYETTSTILAALRNAANFDVMNNSWGYSPLYDASQNLSNPSSASSLIASTFDYVSANGRGGLGTIVVQAAGNEGLNANGEGLSATRHTLSVSAADQYGNITNYTNWGANILISAPDAAYTTDMAGNAGFNMSGSSDGDPLTNTSYTSVFGGTSAATPVVSGVVALMLDANPNLGWRDVHNILALSASHTGSGLSAGATGFEVQGWAVSNSGHWNGGGMAHSVDYGYGMVDALAAVSMAEVWNVMFGPAQTSANERHVSASTTATVAIPDPGTATIQTTVAQNIDVETVMVTVSLTHGFSPDLSLTLIAPDGSQYLLTDGRDLAALFNQNAYVDMSGGFTWTFGVEGARGLSSAGTWQLRVTDSYALDSGYLTNFRVDIYGATDPGYEVHTFTDDFLLFRAIDASRGTISSTSANDWLNLAGVTGNVSLTLDAGKALRVNGTYWATLAANSTFSQLATGAGNDTVDGGSGNDTIYTGMGNDSLLGGIGNDSLHGGSGNDTIRGSDGIDVVWGDLGRDLVYLGNDNDTFWDDGQNDANGADTVYGGAGNDTVNGGGGADAIYGEAGADSLVGGIGNDTIRGGSDNDTIRGVDGNDVAWGDGGRDLAFLGNGNDVFWDDTQNYADTVYGGAGNDTVNGSGGSDLVFGEAGADSLFGGAGDDTIRGGDNYDTIRGGDGNDQVWGDYGRDLVFLGNDNDIFWDNAQNDINGADTVYGGTGNDTVNGAGGADLIYGEGGNDSLVGGIGDDTIRGGGNYDTIRGGDGNDQVWGDDGRDLIFLGNDNDVFWDNAQNDVHGADTVYGGNGDDTVNGDGGDDLIFGEAGNDWLTGGVGNDTLWGGADADQFVFTAGCGADLVADFTDDLDTLVIDDALWGGAALTVSEVLAAYATIVGADAVFDFGGGNTITIAGLATTDLLADDLVLA